MSNRFWDHLLVCSPIEKHLFFIYCGSSLFVIGLEYRAVVIAGSSHSSVNCWSSIVNSHC